MLDNGVRFVVIGGLAMRANGAVDRVTHDLDILLNLDHRSATALATYFKSVNFMVDVKRVVDAMLEDGYKQIPFFADRVHQADLLTRAKGVLFDEIISRPVAFGEQVLPVALRLDLIRLKEISLQSSDPEDVKQKHRADIQRLKELEVIAPQERTRAT